MKILEKLFGGGKRSSRDAGTDPASHIAAALDAAGLGRDADAHGIRGTIDRALGASGLATPATRRAARPAPQVAPDDASRARGEFLQASFANAHGRRDYRLYLPAGYEASGAPRPLLLMLHGCTQSAEDFAVGTRMNALADRHGFLVAYPQQAGKANHAKCWNWFRPEDQRRDAGEPSVLAGIVARLAEDHRIDPGRVFVAGLSAGAAMAVVLGRTYPERFRAVGVHSGLPYASAHDVPSAFAAMQGSAQAPSRATAAAGPAVPVILFHGDADRTVAPLNADRLYAQSMPAGASARRDTGRAPGGQAYTRDVVSDAAGVRVLERWIVHGAGHAWSGGDPRGSYTDAAGPDASAAMVDFFLQQATRGAD